MKTQIWKSRRLLLTIIATLMLSVTVIPSSYAQDDEGDEPLLPQQSYLPLDLALVGASAALDACADEGYGVSVTVVDTGGVQKVHLRADGAGPHTIGSSAGKAYTAASMKRATLGLANFVGENPALEGLRDLDDRILILGGGLPIQIDDVVVGGIGVSGAPSGDIDDACVQAGIDSMLAKLKIEVNEK
ncbi:MAG: heme-binding protein [Caldilineaceae bacterium]